MPDTTLTPTRIHADKDFMPTTVRQAIKSIESNGWVLIRTKGSHR